MCRKLLFTVVALISALSVGAQSPVSWSSTIEMTSETEGIISLYARIASGWHLYGTKVPEGGPVATSFAFTDVQGLNLVGDVKPSRNPIEIRDKVFNLDLSWWDNDVSFAQKFKLEDDNVSELECTIRYMACDDNTCMPPKKDKIKLKIPNK